MHDAVRLPRRIYAIAAVVGIAILAPLYVMEARIAELSPPAVTHPEHYYGFVGLVLVRQMVLGAGLADLTWLLLFVIAWRRTPTAEAM